MRLPVLRGVVSGFNGVCGGMRCRGGGQGAHVSIGDGGGRYILPWTRPFHPRSLLLIRSLRTRSLKVSTSSEPVVLPRPNHCRSFSTTSSSSNSRSSITNYHQAQVPNTALVQSSASRPLIYKLRNMASSQQRDHGGHSHGHHHHHDNTYLTSKNKADAGVRITRLGLYTNVGMAIGKGIGGWYFNSQALVAIPTPREKIKA
jgi:hypothetical protein